MTVATAAIARTENAARVAATDLTHAMHLLMRLKAGILLHEAAAGSTSKNP